MSYGRWLVLSVRLESAMWQVDCEGLVFHEVESWWKDQAKITRQRPSHIHVEGEIGEQEIYLDQ